MLSTFRQKYIPRPFVQLICSSVVLFANPGLYGSITGLGAGGGKPTSAQVGSITNCALYAVYAVVSMVSGPVINLLGPKWAAALGSLTYPLYAAGLWIYSDTGDNPSTVPPILFGSICGVGAGILWPTAAYLCYAYATESEKALYFAVQWTMVAVGSAIGAFIAFGYNFHQTEATGTPVAIYIIFIAIMLFGTAFSFFTTLDPKDVRRKDGRAIAIIKPTTIRDELAGLLEMYKNWKIMTIFPIAMGAEVTLSLCSTLSSHWYNLRTRCLLNIVFWVIQIPTTFGLKWILAREYRRRTQALFATAFLVLVTAGAWITEFLFLTLGDGVHRSDPAPGTDWTSSGADFAPHFIAYGIFFGIIYAYWQGLAQWLMASMTNDPRILARYSGVFKSGCSAGMAISFGIDGAGAAYMAEAIWQCILQVVGLGLMILLALAAVTDTNYFREENVIVPAEVEERTPAAIELYLNGNGEVATPLDGKKA